jgi:hypothetical protein
MDYEELYKLFESGSIDKLKKEIEKLEDEYQKLKKPNVDKMDVTSIQKELDILDNLDAKRKHFHKVNNPLLPAFDDISSLDLSREIQIRYRTLTDKLYYIKRNAHGDPKKRIKARRLLRKNKVKVGSWNDITWQEIEDLLNQHGLSV